MKLSILKIETSFFLVCIFSDCHVELDSDKDFAKKSIVVRPVEIFMSSSIQLYIFVSDDRYHYEEIIGKGTILFLITANHELEECYWNYLDVLVLGGLGVKNWKNLVGSGFDLPAWVSLFLFEESVGIDVRFHPL